MYQCDSETNGNIIKLDDRPKENAAVQSISLETKPLINLLQLFFFPVNEEL